MSNKIWKRGAAVTLGSLALMVTTATTASATVLEHGSDRAEATQWCMRAYDGEADGNGVYGDAYLANGAHVSAWDGNGADGNWGPWQCYSSKIDRFRVCEDRVGCSDWKHGPSSRTTARK